MPRPTWNLLRAAIRRAAPAAASDPLSDAELLARFARGRDEAAFELLLWRHAGLVLGVCRRHLADEHLAEDAFQATFLILARKACGVRGSLPGYLHRVARRVAVRAAAKGAARRKREVMLATEPAATGAEVTDDLRAVLDAEIDRLGERFRRPVVLCYLQGHTTEEAARLLGIPRGTVLSRLSAARAKLASRLTRRGVTLPTAGLTALVTAEQVASAYRVAINTTVTGPAAVLATEVLHMTTWKQAAGLAAAVVVTAGLATGLGVVASGPSGAGGEAQAQAKPDAPPKAEPSAAKIAAAKTAEEAKRVEDIERRNRLVQTEANIRARLDDMLERRQRLASEHGADVDVKALRAQIEQIDARILGAEDEIVQATSTEKSVRQSLAQIDTLRPHPNEVMAYVNAIPSVRRMSLDVQFLRQQLDNLSAKLAADHPSRVSAEKSLTDTMTKLETMRNSATADAEKQLTAKAQDGVRTRLQEAVERVESCKRGLTTYHDKRARLVQRIAKSRAAEDASQLLDDEIQVYRELRQQLLRQRVVMEHGLNDTPAADARVDLLARQVEELKAEVQRLRSQKESPKRQ